MAARGFTDRGRGGSIQSGAWSRLGLWNGAPAQFERQQSAVVAVSVGGTVGRNWGGDIGAAVTREHGDILSAVYAIGHGGRHDPGADINPVHETTGVSRVDVQMSRNVALKHQIPVR